MRRRVPRRTLAALAGFAALVAAAWMANSLGGPPPRAPMLPGGAAAHLRAPAVAAWSLRDRLDSAPVAPLGGLWREATGMPFRPAAVWLAAGDAALIRLRDGTADWGLVIRPRWPYRLAVATGLARPAIPPVATRHGWAVSPDPEFAAGVDAAATADTTDWGALRLMIAGGDRNPVGAPTLALDVARDTAWSARLSLRVEEEDWRAGPMHPEGPWRHAAFAVHAADGPGLAAVIAALGRVAAPVTAAIDADAALPGVRWPDWHAPDVDGWTDCGAALVAVDTRDLVAWPVFAAAGLHADTAHPFAPMIDALPQIPHRWGAAEGVVAPVLGEAVALCAAQPGARWHAATREAALHAVLAAPKGPPLHCYAWIGLDWPRLRTGVAALADGWIDADRGWRPIVHDALSAAAPSAGVARLIAHDAPVDGILVFHGALRGEAEP